MGGKNKALFSYAENKFEFDAFAKIYRIEDMSGLYLDFIPETFGVSHGALQFITYEEMKNQLYCTSTEIGGKTSLLCSEQHLCSLPEIFKNKTILLINGNFRFFIINLMFIAIRVAATEESLFNIPLDDLAALNESIAKCAIHITAELESESSGCPISFDSILCWPKTQLGHTAILPCFKELNGLQYDSTQNATRYCHIDGTWDNVNYERCYHIPIPAATGSPFAPHVEITTFIYFSGYILSLFALSIAVIVFLRLKDLRCLRNKIHLNLFLTYILTALLWILTLIIQLFIQEDGSGCIFLVILLHYFSLTNFFWMMVEGLYLYTLVVQTFSGDNLSLRMYALIGWGCPAIFVICWTIVKAALISIDDGIITKYSNMPEFDCAWLKESYVDWIYQGPACAVLIINSIFLVQIMWVLITKLRSANTIETRQYRKASKALLVLIPLLGTTYLVVLAGPEKGVGSIIFAVIRAFLLSTQGFSVSLFYCFLNSEVRQAIRHRFNIWRDERNISSSTHGQSKRYNTSKDYLRSRTESIRFNSTSPVNSV